MTWGWVFDDRNLIYVVLVDNGLFDVQISGEDICVCVCFYSYSFRAARTFIVSSAHTVNFLNDQQFWLGTSNVNRFQVVGTF